MAQKIDGYRRRASYEWWKWRNSAAAKRREKSFGKWLQQLSDYPPDVLIGANFATFGGVRHHLQAIRKYSSLKIELAPSERLMQKLSPHHIVHDFGDKFLKLPPGKVKAVHSHVYPWFIDWCLEQQQKGTRWIHTYHLNYYPEHGSNDIEPWQAAINKSLFNIASRADVKISVSEWQKEELLQKHGITTQYLPNGVDVELCDAGKAGRFFRKIRIKDFILYVGRNDPVKNPVDFVRLAALMREHRFVMVGGGLSEDSLAEEFGLEVPGNLTVIGALSHSEVQDAIAACSVLVVTSKREGLPTLVMEGMTQRKAVVVPNEVGCLEVVNHGECGHVYELGDIDDLAEKTSRALSDTKLGERARRRVLSDYDWRIIAPKLDAIYKGERHSHFS